MKHKARKLARQGILNELNDMTLDFEMTIAEDAMAAHASHHKAEEGGDELSESEENLTFRQKVFIFMDVPESSPGAHIFACVMGVLIILSVFSMVLESIISPNSDTPHPEEEVMTWFVLETCFTGMFSIELLTRVLVADAMGTQTLGSFFSEPSNICDIAAVAPWYIEFIFSTVASEFRMLRTVRLIRLVRLMRLARMGRVAKLVKISALFGPIAACLTVIWGIYIKLTLSD
jgi:hypothetical protein